MSHEGREKCEDVSLGYGNDVAIGQGVRAVNRSLKKKGMGSSLGTLKEAKPCNHRFQLTHNNFKPLLKILKFYLLFIYLFIFCFHFETGSSYITV
jgi:hypothetical protein